MTLEVTSIRPQGNYWKAWAQWSSPKDETSTGYPLFTWRSYKELSYYDCKHGSVATKQLVYYDGENGAGNAVRTLSTPEGNLRFDDPIPGTLGDTLHRYVCRNRK